MKDNYLKLQHYAITSNRANLISQADPQPPHKDEFDDHPGWGAAYQSLYRLLFNVISGRGPGSFTIMSGYGANTQQPYVEINGPSFAQISPENARELAQNLYAAAEAADTDAFLVQHLQQAVGLEPEKAIHFLANFREWRDALRTEKYGAGDNDSP
jgi:hypothetical protein